MKNKSTLFIKVLFCFTLFLNSYEGYCEKISDPECDACADAYCVCKDACGPLTYNSFGMANGDCILTCFSTLYHCVYGTCFSSPPTGGTPTWTGTIDNIRLPLNIIPGATIPLSVGLYDSLTSSWGGAGVVTAVNFYIISIDSFNLTAPMTDKEWLHISTSSFNTNSNLWSASYTVPNTFTVSPHGYVLAARFLTPEAASGQYLLFGATPPPNISVPTLSEWGMIIFGLGLLLAGVFYIRRI